MDRLAEARVSCWAHHERRLRRAVCGRRDVGGTADACEDVSELGQDEE